MKAVNSRLYLYISLAVVLVIILLMSMYLFSSVSTSEKTEYVYIDDNDTQDSIIVKMHPFSKSMGLSVLNILIRHSDYAENILTGKYAIEPKDNPITIFRRLKHGRQTAISLVIPEVRTMDRLAHILSQKLMLDSSTIANALYNEEICQRYGYDTLTIAAMFVPNTYEVYWNISIDHFLDRMNHEHDNFWHSKREDKAAQIQLTPIEVATLASIIDEETANNTEKTLIARMYLNRLQRNMPLQADPTIKFALKQFEIKRIYQKLLQVDSPFNTYLNEGLPPGPIKIASIKGIDAVLNAPEHDFLYMCAKEDFSGTHNFARTYPEHLMNAAKYTKALNQRGIK